MFIFVYIHYRPIHGLIFLFKWVQDDEPAGTLVQDNRLDKIFFAKQVNDFYFIIFFSPKIASH